MGKKKTQNTKPMEQTKQNKLFQCSKTEQTVPNNIGDYNSLYLDEETKVRRMSLQLYADPSQWGAVLLEAEHYAYIYHDKDTNADGTPKTPHYHLLLVFKNPRYRGGVRKLFDVSEDGEDSTINFQKLGQPHSAFKYLRHATQEAKKEGKYQYDINEVVCDDINYWEEHASDIDNFDFLADLENLDARSMALRYGRDYIKNYKRYDDFAHMLKIDSERKIELENLTLAEAVLNSADGFDYRVQIAIADFLVRVIRHNKPFNNETVTEDGLRWHADTKTVVNELLAKIEELTYIALAKEGV